MVQSRSLFPAAYDTRPRFPGVPSDTGDTISRWAEKVQAKTKKRIRPSPTLKSWTKRP